MIWSLQKKNDAAGTNVATAKKIL
ncbi:hypothetical protein RDI58_028542 [Solanum bulbocastanum]|uniref:Uncharacterized protein n=1 Tax=Solanum bulbocastanum TaxID=147425 RepID=A0AAN8XZ24_SOLBU